MYRDKKGEGVDLARNCKLILNFSGWGGLDPSHGREFWSERHLSGFAVNEIEPEGLTNKCTHTRAKEFRGGSGG